MDFTEHDKLVEAGYLLKKISPCGDLVLYSYTDKCTYEKYWNNITISSRGTVYEIKTGRVVAKAFDKFFNFNELPPSKQEYILKQDNFTVTKKMDGSLGILYYYNGWKLNTRGSFESDQAKEGLKVLHEKYNVSALKQNLTYLVEIIYPENRIVINYGDMRELIVLAIFSPEFGVELSGNQFDDALIDSNMCAVVSFVYSFDKLFELQKTLPITDEGFVVRLNTNGDRVKFKCQEYMKIARIIANATPLEIWKNMVMGEVSKSFVKELSILPDELHEEIKNIIKTLEHKYLVICDEIYLDYNTLRKQIETECGDSVFNIKKEMGLRFKSYKHGGAVFSVHSECHECIDKYIMKLIRPSANKLE